MGRHQPRRGFDGEVHPNPGSTFRVGTRYWHSLTLSTLRSEALCIHAYPLVVIHTIYDLLLSLHHHRVHRNSTRRPTGGEAWLSQSPYLWAMPIDPEDMLG